MSQADFAAPIEDRWFEDYTPGAVYEFGGIEVTEAAIIDFARRFDPQPMHVDPEAAARGNFGGLIASGWHTAGMMMRLFVEHFLPHARASPRPASTSCAGPGRCGPATCCSIRVTVLEATRSRSRPDRGMVRTLVEVLNQNGEIVMSLKPMNLLRCRALSHPLPRLRGRVRVGAAA